MSESLVDAGPRSVGGKEVGPLAYGLWRFTDSDLKAGRAIVEAALEAGMNLFDNADVYGFDWGGTGFGLVEELLGKVLASSPGLRGRMVLATKGGIFPPLPYDSSPKYLRDALEASMRRMQVDYVDIYQIHRPDMFSHPADVAGALDEMVDSGKVGCLGVSNHTAAQTSALNAHLNNKLASMQPQFSAAHLEPMRDGNFDLAMEIGLTPLAWSPLAGGRLATGSDVPVALVEVMDDLAAREAVTRADIALAFVLCHPSRPVAIVGTQNLERIAGASAALQVNLDRNDVYDMVEASEGQPLP